MGFVCRQGNQASCLLTVVVTAGAGFLLQFVLAKIDWFAANMGVMNQAVGLLVPVAMLLIADNIMKKQLTVVSTAS